MRIATYDRTVYQHNPLAEVVCQLRFKNAQRVDESTVALIAAELAKAGYPLVGEGEVTFVLEIELSSQSGPPIPSQSRVFHFLSEDREWKVSVCRDFIAFSTDKYLNWPDFAARLKAAVGAYFAAQPSCRLGRLGLRYKDLIEREEIGLDGVSWDELIQSFLLGPLAPDSLDDNQRATEDDVDAFTSQSMLRLSDARVLLTSALLISSSNSSQRAFLIDADFFNEGDFSCDIASESEGLMRELDALHLHAGALFRRSIKDRLHYALCPSN
jgi:uncharacterized protein (TIGR04255 family)